MVSARWTSHARTMSIATAAPPQQLVASEVVRELVATVVAARGIGADGDLVLTDRLESLALCVWEAVHEQLGLPRWTAVTSPRHRWVGLERSVGRLHQRLDDPGLRSIRVGEEGRVALGAARSAWQAAQLRTAPPS
jgi:hypothetical protein